MCGRTQTVSVSSHSRYKGQQQIVSVYRLQRCAIEVHAKISRRDCEFVPLVSATGDQPRSGRVGGLAISSGFME